MNGLPVFLIDRLIFRISSFLRHWYVLSFKIYVNFIISLLEKLDRIFSFKITYKYLFSPLYGDRTIIGYFFGFIFRIFRLFFGGIFYAAFMVLSVIPFLIWAAVPLFIIYKIAKYSPAIGMLQLDELPIFEN